VGGGGGGEGGEGASAHGTMRAQASCQPSAGTHTGPACTPSALPSLSPVRFPHSHPEARGTPTHTRSFTNVTYTHTHLHYELDVHGADARMPDQHPLPDCMGHRKPAQREDHGPAGHAAVYVAEEGHGRGQAAPGGPNAEGG
jgi:hypothetical protein